MLYLETHSTSAPYNLAMEEALAEDMGRRGGEGCFCLWQNGPAVIIGRHQNALSEVNLPELRRRGLDLVRRLTGGGAVYHDLGNLNFTFLVPLAGRREVTQAGLLAPLLAYLRAHGVTAAAEGRNDLSIPGHGKFSGLASRQAGPIFQLHGTLLYDVDMGVLGEVLLVDPAKYQSKGVASVRARVTNLKPYLGLELGEFWAGLRRAYDAADGEVPPAVRQRAAQLVAERYGREEWNVGQSPPGDVFAKNRFPFGSLELHLGVEKNAIASAKVTGDFLLALPVAEMEAALVGLPADRPATWAGAWGRLGLEEAITAWVAGL